MRKVLSTLLLTTALAVGAASLAPAAEQASRSAPPAAVETLAGSLPSSAFSAPQLLAQYGSNSDYSSSRSTRIPRGAVKLVIMLIVGVISLCGWALKKVLAG